MKLSGKFFFNHPFVFILVILTYVYGFFCLPFSYLKRKILGLDSYKTAIFNILNKFYNSELNENDYFFDNSILPGSKIYKRNSELTLFATSLKAEKGACFQILVDKHMDDLGMPQCPDIQKSLQRLTKLFKIEQSLNIHLDHREVSRLILRMLFTPPEKSSRFNSLFNSTFILQIELNPEFETVKFQKFITTHDLSAMLQNAKFYDGMPFNEVSLIIYLENLKDCEDIHDLLPEIRTPSAYNFSSADFKNRLLLAEMLDY